MSPKTQFNLSLDQILRKPIYLLVPVFFITIISLVGLGLFYSTHNSSLALNSVPAKGPDTAAVPAAQLTLKEPSVSAPVSLDILSNPSNELIERGKQLFITTCVSCHGTNGNGDGLGAAALNPKPRNFRSTDGWKNGRKLIEMYKSLQEGIPGSAMSSYSSFSPLERIALIHFIRTMMSSPPAASPEEIKQLDAAYGLTKTTNIPGELPLDGAEKLLVAKARIDADKISTVTARINSLAKSDYGAYLFRSVTYSATTALSLIIKNPRVLDGNETFRAAVVQSIGRNGFSARFNLLSNDELNILSTFLKNKLQ